MRTRRNGRMTHKQRKTETDETVRADERLFHGAVSFLRSCFFFAVNSYSVQFTRRQNSKSAHRLFHSCMPDVYLTFKTAQKKCQKKSVRAQHGIRQGLSPPSLAPPDSLAKSRVMSLLPSHRIHVLFRSGSDSVLRFRPSYSASSHSRRQRSTTVLMNSFRGFSHL